MFLETRPLLHLHHHTRLCPQVASEPTSPRRRHHNWLRLPRPQTPLPLPLPSDMPQPVAPILGAELSDASYLTEVLRLPANTTETDLDRELAAKATALGISISRPSTATVATNHARTASGESNATTDTALTSHSSTSPNTNTESQGNGESACNGNPAPTTRARSRSLNFSQYDKYLAQIDPMLKQPKFHRLHPPPSDPAPSLFSVSTRKSYTSFKNGIKAKVRWRKRPPTPGATM